MSKTRAFTKHLLDFGTAGSSPWPTRTSGWRSSKASPRRTSSPRRCWTMPWRWSRSPPRRGPTSSSTWTAASPCPSWLSSLCKERERERERETERERERPRSGKQATGRRSTCDVAQIGLALWSQRVRPFISVRTGQLTISSGVRNWKFPLNLALVGF